MEWHLYDGAKHFTFLQHRGKVTDEYVRALKKLKAPYKPKLTLHRLKTILPISRFKLTNCSGVASCTSYCVHVAKCALSGKPTDIYWCYLRNIVSHPNHLVNTSDSVECPPHSTTKRRLDSAANNKKYSLFRDLRRTGKEKFPL